MASTEFYIDRALVPRAEMAQSATFLIGSYAGWPNLGTYMQLRSSIDVHKRIRAHHNLWILLDARSKAAHEGNKITFSPNGAGVFPVYCHFGEETPALDDADGLVRLPHVPSSMLIHIYGGAFINDEWGHPVRAAVCELIDRQTKGNVDSQVRLFVSGLQVSPSAEINTWLPLLARADYVGTRDEETAALLKGLLDHDAEQRIQYSGDDSLLALAASLKNGVNAETTFAAHINLADYPSANADRRLERIAAALVAAAPRFGAELTCDLLVAHPSDLVPEQEVAQRLEAIYGRAAATAEAPHLTFRLRNIFSEAAEGQFRFGASVLVTCSYHVALAGLLSNCPTLLLVENDCYRQKAAGLAEAFKTHRFASVRECDEVGAAVAALLVEGTNRPPGNAPNAMWLGQAEKALRLSRLCLDMERAQARTQLELTAAAFRDVAAQLGELRRRRILEERLAKEAREHTAFTISIPTSEGLAKYLAKSYWSRRKSRWLRSIRKRVHKLT